MILEWARDPKGIADSSEQVNIEDLGGSMSISIGGASSSDGPPETFVPPTQPDQVDLPESDSDDNREVARERMMHDPDLGFMSDMFDEAIDHGDFDAKNDEHEDEAFDDANKKEIEMAETEEYTTDAAFKTPVKQLKKNKKEAKGCR